MSKPEKIDLQQYCGNYSMDDDCVVAQVTIKNSVLYMSFTEKPDFNEALFLIGGHQFSFASDPGKSTMLRFNTGEDGNITSLEFLNYKFKKINK